MWTVGIESGSVLLAAELSLHFIFLLIRNLTEEGREVAQ